MGTLQLGGYNTLRTSTELTVGAPIDGAPLSEVVASWVDTDGATNTTGFIIPMIYDRANWFDGPVAATSLIPTITACTLHNHNYKGKAIYNVTLDAEYPTLFRKNEKLSIGSFGAPNVYLGALDVFQILPPDGVATQLLLATNPYYTESQVILAASMVGENIFSIHRWSAGADLGIMKVSLGVGTPGVGEVRLALCLTRDPQTALTYAQRLALNEIAWSSFYPVGSQVTIDFSGLHFESNGYYPPTGVAPSIVGPGERRLMLGFFWETTPPGGALPATFITDIDITYKTDCVIDQNGIRKI